MDNGRIHELGNRIWWALGFMALGVYFLLQNIGDWRLLHHHQHLWPVFVVLIGGSIIIQARQIGQVIDGLLVFLLGGLLLASNVGWLGSWHLHIGQLWPLAIVYVGLKILLFGWEKDKNLFAYHRQDKDLVHDSVNEIMIQTVFGGGDYRFDNRTIKKGFISTVLVGVPSICARRKWRPVNWCWMSL